MTSTRSDIALNQWEQLKAVQRMQDYIEAHLTAPITLSALARAARYSPWYAARLFKQHVGKTPFEYIRLRRLSAAAERLQASNERVLDVALDFLFDSHDGFTRAFTKQFGVVPSRLRGTQANPSSFIPLMMRDYFVARQKGTHPMTATKNQNVVFVQVVDHPARKVVLKRARTANHYFEYCEEVGCDVWETLGHIEGALREPMGMWLPDAMKPEGTSTYVQGVEVPADFSGQVPEGYEVTAFAACKMMVFQGPPFEDKDFSEAISSLWDAINAYRPETYGFTWADDAAPRFQLSPLGYRGYIEGRPVRQIGPDA
jgi:AraC-like DNA-binding protein